MTGVIAVLAGASKRRPITVSPNWGSDDGPSPVSSVAATLTVPASNPGSLRFVINSSSGGSSQSYSKNGGAPTSFSNGTIITVANGDTLTFAFSGLLGNTGSYTLYDNTTNTVIGTWSASIS